MGGAEARLFRRHSSNLVGSMSSEAIWPVSAARTAEIFLRFHSSERKTVRAEEQAARAPYLQPRTRGRCLQGGAGSPWRLLCLTLATTVFLSAGDRGESWERLQDQWWAVGRTEVRVFDHSWLTPRMVCGFRFVRIPEEHGFSGRFLVDLALDDGASSTPSSLTPSPTRAMLWTFDGAAFQRKALDFFSGKGPPPLEDVWLVHLLASIPSTKRFDVLAIKDLMEIKCSAIFQLAEQLFVDYLSHVVPPAVMLKHFQNTFVLHSREGLKESAEDLAANLKVFQPFETALERLQMTVEQISCTRSSNGLSSHGFVCPTIPDRVQTPLVDVVVARCHEDLSWLQAWMARVLRDEWTPEVPGVRLRLLIFERCEEPTHAEFPDPHGAVGLDKTNYAVAEAVSGPALLAALRRAGAPVAEGSRAIDLREPPGFENVPYVYYCRNDSWADADFAFFMHGSPFDHLDAQTLDDVLRSMALGTYGTPFLHLNTKRTPLAEIEPCVRDLLAPSLAAASTSGMSDARSLPDQTSTYCCSQFVVARSRIRQVPVAFWEAVWAAMEVAAAAAAGRVSDAASQADALPASCRGASERVYESHHRYNSSDAAGQGVWSIVLERLWHSIFGEDGDLPIRETDARLPLFLRVRRTRATVDGGPRGSLEDLVFAPEWGFNPGQWGASQVISDVTGVPLVASVEPVPTRLFADAARYGWTLPPWVRTWLAADGLGLDGHPLNSI